MTESLKNFSFLGLIPARGGSVAIPKKNIQNAGGKPLIFWTICAALKSRALDRVIVSTDDETILCLSKSFGAEVPFKRPRRLARHDTPGIDVVIHLLEWLKKKGQMLPRYVMLLQPTSPLRTSRDIQEAIQIARKTNADSVVSVCRTLHHPYWMKRIMPDGLLRDFSLGTHRVTRRQDLPDAYALNGAIYLSKTELLLKKKTFYSRKSYAYLMPPERSVDIDSPWDLKIADWILRQRNYHGAS